jgi:septal ring factor EnvC (AmiA/AmiB activator)
VFGGVGGGLAWKSSSDKQSAIQAAQAKQIAETEAQMSKLTADLKAQQDAMEAAKSELAGAKSEAERTAAQARIAAAQEQQKKTQANIAAVRGGGPARPAGGGTPRPACTCQAGDPLCACL